MSGPGVHLGHQLDDGLDLLAEVGVRDAEDRRVGDLRVGDEEVLALLGVDVDPSGDDHEGGAIGEIEVAVVIEVPDIPNCDHRPVG